MRKSITIAILASLAVAAAVALGTPNPNFGTRSGPTMCGVGGTSGIQTTNYPTALKPTVSGCGTGATVDGTNCGGTIHTGASTTSCTLTWATSSWDNDVTWLHAPPCQLEFVDTNAKGEVRLYIGAQSTSAMTFKSVTDMGASDINYSCMGGY